MTADLSALIDAITIPVGLVGLYFWIKFCIAIIRAKAQEG
ncbi:Uncharacterised protein [Brevundimonas diminuta]|nr:putative membrane protein [Brevundimonas diminuta ATCC 11568]SUW17347.1 Uncharacterised protein [Brevundimonas diminuta]SUW85817.1 Uncharacterised protein [Brevundimonas diminuta]